MAGYKHTRTHTHTRSLSHKHTQEHTHELAAVLWDMLERQRLSVTEQGGEQSCADGTKAGTRGCGVAGVAGVAVEPVGVRQEHWSELDFYVDREMFCAALLEVRLPEYKHIH